jgi:oligo-1,6-glucosidase
MTVGETQFSEDAEKIVPYVLPDNKELQMVFQFQMMELDGPPGPRHQPLTHRDWKLTELKTIVNRWANFHRDEGFWNA